MHRLQTFDPGILSFATNILVAIPKFHALAFPLLRLKQSLHQWTNSVQYAHKIMHLIDYLTMKWLLYFAHKYGCSKW
jgi:hypothetical protein